MRRGVYERLVEVDEDHGCGDLPEEVCREVPGNAGRLIASLSRQKAGDRVVDAKTVLAWLLAVVGAPVHLTGLLEALRTLIAGVPGRARRGRVLAARSLPEVTAPGVP